MVKELNPELNKLTGAIIDAAIEVHWLLACVSAVNIYFILLAYWRLL